MRLCTSMFVACLFVVCSCPQTALAQDPLPACYLERECNDRGTAVRAALVPESRLVTCENWKAKADDADAAKARADDRFAKAIADGKTIRRERELCLGELGAVGVLLEGVQAERDANLVRATIAEGELADRWAPHTVFLFGVVVGAVGVGALGVWLALR